MVLVATCPSDSSPGMGGVSREGVSRNAETTDTAARQRSARRARKRRRRSRRCQNVVSAVPGIGTRSVSPAAAPPSQRREKPRRLARCRRLLGLGERLRQRPLGIRVLLRLGQLPEYGELLADHVACRLALSGEDLRLEPEHADLPLAAGHLPESAVHGLLGFGKLLLLEVDA